jgi:hypothetical protein
MLEGTFSRRRGWNRISRRSRISTGRAVTSAGGMPDRIPVVARKRRISSRGRWTWIPARGRDRVVRREDRDPGEHADPRQGAAAGVGDCSGRGLQHGAGQNQPGTAPGLQYFNKVETEVDPTDIPNRKNLVIGVEEGSSGSFYMGAGFSSVENLFGYVGMTQGNFDLFNPPYLHGWRAAVAAAGNHWHGNRTTNCVLSSRGFWAGGSPSSWICIIGTSSTYSDEYTQTETGARVGIDEGASGGRI